METAVERDGFGEQFITGGMGALQPDHAAAIVPRWRHDDDQLDVWEAGDFLQFALVGTHQTGFRYHQDTHRHSITSTS